jgi:hypothetical protein
MRDNFHEEVKRTIAALCVAGVVIIMYSPREGGRDFGGFKRS